MKRKKLKQADAWEWRTNCDQQTSKAGNEPVILYETMVILVNDVGLEQPRFH